MEISALLEILNRCKTDADGSIGTSLNQYPSLIDPNTVRCDLETRPEHIHLNSTRDGSINRGKIIQRDGDGSHGNGMYSTN